MSAVPADPGCSPACSSPASNVRMASPSRPCATWMSARARRAAEDVRDEPGVTKLLHGLGVAAPRRLEVAEPPVREPHAARPRCPGRRDRCRSTRSRARPACAMVAGDVAGQQREPGSVDRHLGREPRRARRRRRRSAVARRPVRVGAGRATARRSAAAARRRPCRRSPCARRPVTPSTGRAGKSSSGSASSQRRNVVSCRVWRIIGAASSISSAARTKSSPSQGVADRLGGVALRGEPRARPSVELAGRASAPSPRSRARSTSAKRWW